MLGEARDVEVKRRGRGSGWVFWGLALIVLLSIGLLVVDWVDDSTLDEDTLAVPIESLEEAETIPTPDQDTTIDRTDGPYR